MSNSPRRNPRISPELSGGERVRLLLLFALAIAVTLVLLQMMSQQEEDPEPPSPPKTEVPVIDITENVPPWDPPKSELNRLIQDGGQRGRLTSTPDALKLLAPRVRDRSHARFRADPSRADVGGFRLVTGAELVDPANRLDLRGEPVEVHGRLDDQGLQAVDPAVHGLTEVGFPVLFGGNFLAEDGTPVRFLVMQPEEDGTHSIPMVARPLKLLGVFYRLVEEDLDSGGLKVFPFVLATRIRERIPLEVDDVLSPGIEENIRAIEEFQLGNTPHREDEFYDVLGYVLSKGETLTAEGEEVLELEGRDPLDRPNKYRLKPVKFSGVLVYVGRESFEYEDMRPEDAPVLGYWHLILSKDDPEVNAPIGVIVPKENIPDSLKDFIGVEDRGQKGRPLVTVEGIYYRVHSYLSRGGRQRAQEVHLPLMIASSISVKDVPKGKPVRMKGFFMGFLGLGLLMGGALTWMVWRDRKRAVEMDKKIREQRLSRRKAQGMDLNKESRGLLPDDNS